MPDSIDRADYVRWNHSPDWVEVIVPEIEAEIARLGRQLAVIDLSTSSIEAAVIQGEIRGLQRLMDAPRLFMERQWREEAKKDEQKNNAGAGPEPRREARRLLNWARGHR